MNLAQVEKISKALADETRLAIYEAIAADGGLTCGDLAEMEKVTPATISHHLKILVDVGLIACRKKGQFLHSQVKRGTMREYSEALERLAAGISKSRGKRRKTSP